MTIIKNTEGWVFGGYASEALSSTSEGSWEQDENSFIFTLRNPTNQPLKLKVIRAEYALFHDSNYGPVFGTRNLIVADQSNINRESSMVFDFYNPPKGKTGQESGKFVVGSSGPYFQTSEIEVFQIEEEEKIKFNLPNTENSNSSAPQTSSSASSASEAAPKAPKKRIRRTKEQISQGISLEQLKEEQLKSELM